MKRLWTLMGVSFALVGYGGMPGDEGQGQVAASENAIGRYEIISNTRDFSVPGRLRKFDTVVEVGGDSRNRFIMHRIHRTGPQRGAIMLLPPLVNNFNVYMVDESGDPTQSIAAQLALAGYDVYGYSPRQTGLPPRPCTTGAFDCSVMLHWNWSEAFLPDIDYIRQRVHGNVKPAVGGLSRGGMLGLASVNFNPTEYSGLFLWDAMLYSANPAIVTFNTNNCNFNESLLAKGIYFNEGVAAGPKNVVPLGVIPAMNIFSRPAPIGTPSFIQLAPNSTFTNFEFASYTRLQVFVAAWNNVEPVVGSRDTSCSLAGDRTLTGNLAAFTGPILAIKEGLAFGPYMQDTINLTSSTNVRVQDNPAYGHLDSYMQTNHFAHADSLIIDWLDNDVFPVTGQR